MSIVDKGYVVFKTQEDANAFLRSNPDFRPTSMHASWQGKIRCRHCKVAGWVKDIHANKNWSNRHGANCKKKTSYYGFHPGGIVTNTNFGAGSIWINTLSGQLIQQGNFTSAVINNKYNWNMTWNP